MLRWIFHLTINSLLICVLQPMALLSAQESDPPAKSKSTDNTAQDPAAADIVKLRAQSAAEKAEREKTQPVKTIKIEEISDSVVNELTFDDIKFDIEKDGDFERDMLTEVINVLNGKRIKIRGYILPGTRQSGLQKFIMVRDNQECCFGPGAALFDCILVKLKPGTKVDFTVRPVSVEGTFFVKELATGGRTLAVFRMKDVTVE